MTNYIEVQFRPFQPKDAPDLYPKKFRKEIDEFNDWLFPHINNSHYRMTFCQSPEAYDEAYEDFYESLDKLDKRLETNRFLFGDYITDSDVRAYVTLVRWDVAYFKNIGPAVYEVHKGEPKAAVKEEPKEEKKPKINLGFTCVLVEKYV